VEKFGLAKRGRRRDRTAFTSILEGRVVSTIPLSAAVGSSEWLGGR